MNDSIYTVCAYDEETEGRVSWATHVEVMATSERQAISKTKKLAKRKQYRVVTVTTMEVLSARNIAKHRLADAIRECKDEEATP